MTKTQPSTIRARRESLNLTLDQIAQQLNVDKSYVSRIETGLRAATDEQAKEIAEILALPVEMVLLESGRLPSDVRGVIETDAAGATAVVCLGKTGPILERADCGERIGESYGTSTFYAGTDYREAA